MADINPITPIATGITPPPQMSLGDMMNVARGAQAYKQAEQVNPLLHVFGHIHNAYGEVYKGDTLYVNASICNERYVPSNRPIVIDLKEDNGKFVLTYVED